MKNYTFKIHIFEKLILLIILFIPFQQSLTLQIGATVRISDIIICVIFPLMIFKQLEIKRKIIYINAFYLYMLINNLIMTFMLNDSIKYGISTLRLDQHSRSFINIATCLVAIMAYSIGVYIGKYDNIFQKVMKLWSEIIIFLSIYVIIQFIILNVFGDWLHLPGEHLNENTSYAFGLRRAYGFSIEPGALGNLLFFSFLIIFQLLENNKLKKMTLFFCLIAIFCSMSSIAIISAVILIFLLICKKNLSIVYKILVALLLIILIFIMFNNSYLYTATFDKILGDNFSKMDRLTNSIILIRMFCKYPILGVGFGNYGALRNLFSYNTMFQYKGIYDSTNIFYPGLLGELGVLGTILFVKFIVNKFNELKVINKSTLLFIVPFLIIISTMPFITFNYMAIGLGIIYGRYLVYSVDIVDINNNKLNNLKCNSRE